MSVLSRLASPLVNAGDCVRKTCRLVRRERRFPLLRLEIGEPARVGLWEFVGRGSCFIPRFDRYYYWFGSYQARDELPGQHGRPRYVIVILQFYIGDTYRGLREFQL